MTGPGERRPAGGSDPRLRARQRDVARAAGRRRLRRVLVGLGAAGLLAGALALLHSPLLAARHVTVVGARHTTLADVLAVTGLGRRPPLVDVSAVSDAAALEQLPWVAHAEVVRQWPDGVRIVLTERHPVAQVAGAGGYGLVDPTGRVLEVVGTRVPGLVVVDGHGAVPPAGGHVPAAELPAVTAAGAVPVSLVDRVAGATAGSSGVALRLAHGPSVELGGAVSLRAKMVALATLLARVPMNGILTIDLRVPRAPVLTS